MNIITEHTPHLQGSIWNLVRVLSQHTKGTISLIVIQGDLRSMPLDVIKFGLVTVI